MAKDKQAKLPKKIAGVKVPKELRKVGNAARSLAKQPVISELVAAALTAAAASLTAQNKAARSVRRTAEDLTSETVRETAAIGATVKRALLDAARDLIDSLDEKPASADGAKQASNSRGKKKGKAKS
ncbi:MAG TPA: hypothetical protein VNT77_02895 [Allosphingosinicella sp.]|nr:hypothetical protein [Allosphingosinicella sp.]